MTARGYIVRIRRNATGQVVDSHHDLTWDHHSLFWWTEGNFGCDCNRFDCFQNAGGDTGDDTDECGDTRFTAIEAVLPDGTVIPVDQP